MQPTQIQPPPAAPRRMLVQYAGFWRRFVAHLIDQLLIGIVAFMLFIPGLALFGIGLGSGMMEESPDAMGFILAALAAYLAAIVLIVVLQWLYFALMESSSTQATLGKLVLGVIVTDLNGQKISFGRATGRYFGKILSGLILYIGFIMAGLTEKKQALHDIMAGTLVVMK